MRGNRCESADPQPVNDSGAGSQDLSPRLRRRRGEAAAGVVSGRRARGASGETGGLVFVFSGQGPQWPGMGRELLASSEVFAAAVDGCAEALAPHVDWSLTEVLRDEQPLDRVGRPLLAAGHLPDRSQLELPAETTSSHLPPPVPS